MTRFWLRAAAATVLGLASAAAFAGYLQPAMLVEFANLILCG